LRELDRAHAALGGFVAQQGMGSRTRTAIRENCLVSRLDTDNEHGLDTEAYWPALSREERTES
jgi:hypothetical protein